MPLDYSSAMELCEDHVVLKEDVDMDNAVALPKPPSVNTATHDESERNQSQEQPTGSEQQQTSPRERLRNIITTEFDLEIHLKSQEVRAIDEEIAKIHSLMLQIKNAYELNPATVVKPNDTVPEFVEHYAQFLDAKPTPKPPAIPVYDLGNSTEADGMRKRHYSFNHHLSSPAKILRSHSFTTNERPSRLRKPPPGVDTSDLRAALSKPKCIIRRNDGILVRLVCPNCNRDNFGSAQGFINHCRISHALELTTHEAAAMTCGVEIEAQDELGLEAKQRSMDGRPPLVMAEEKKKATRAKRLSKGQTDRVAAVPPTNYDGGKVGGKYKPGFAPNTWSSHAGKSLPGKSLPEKSVPGKSVPGKSIPGKSVPGKSLPGKTLPGNPHAPLARRFSTPVKQGRALFKNEKSRSMSSSLGRIQPTLQESDEDSEDKSEDESSQEGESESEESDGDSLVKKKDSGSAAKTLPGKRGSSSMTKGPVDSLQKFLPLSRFF